MKPWNDEGRTKTHMILVLAAVALLAISATVNAQTLIGSAGAGWQTWTLGDSTTPTDLNDNGAPYWDVPWAASGSYGGTAYADKNAGFCLTSTGDCVGMGSAVFAPGVLPYWGMPYDSAADVAGSTGGARDNTVYFRSTGGPLRATLYLNASTQPTEINEFGWVEVGFVNGVPTPGTRHILFGGSGEPTGSLTPSPVGAIVNFTPTRFFGYYYSDVSEPTDPPNSHGCYAYTLFNFDEPRCTEAGGHQGDHDFIVFSGDAQTAPHPTFWIVGEDPTDCTNHDGDCNLTIVKVTAAPHSD